MAKNSYKNFLANLKIKKLIQVTDHTINLFSNIIMYNINNNINNSDNNK